MEKLLVLGSIVVIVLSAFFSTGCSSTVAREPVMAPVQVEAKELQAPTLAPLHMEHNSLFSCSKDLKVCEQGKLSLR